MQRWLLPLLFILLLVAFASAGGYGGYRYYLLSKSYASSTAQVAALSQKLSVTEDGAANLSDALTAEQSKNAVFENQIQTLSGSVAQIQKLQATDPELLKKYSKVYFLNENYLPESLTVIDPQYTEDTTRTYRILTQVQPILEKMIDDATTAGMSLKVASSYRAFNDQAALKTSYKLTYGTGANSFSADQGYSEHQLGTAIDFTTTKLGSNFTNFAASPEYTWLQNNAYRYGFILSYPKGNTYYEFEPWHWRYVGISLATELHQTGQNFYDLDQRTIDSYLGSFFN
jgi:LAS superfamily LD-carboxypeptidase LdcB